MTPEHRWLAAVWPFVRAQLPPSPATVLEIGCGPLGGFVPALLREGYDAVGVDPEAPAAPGYHRVEFGHYEPPQPADCVVACTSLHHVADLDDVLDKVGATLASNGALVVVEWASERFDEATARWCFARLAPLAPGVEPGWLHRRRDEWAASRQPWMATVGPGPYRKGCTPARRSCAGWMLGSPGSCMSRGRTSSPTLLIPPRHRSRPRSTPGRFRRAGIRYAARRA